MRRLWDQAVETHRHGVRQAIMDTTAALVAEMGLLSVTMSEIAEKAGIGRATLYKYFPDVEAILLAWHERQIAAHLEHLAEARTQAGDPARALEAVLEAYAVLSQASRTHHDTELAALMHHGEHVARARQHLTEFIRDLLAEAVEAGDVRDDVAPAELAEYCLHALSAAGTAQSKATVRRLVQVTLDALRPQG